MKISEVEVVFVKPNNGLIAFASCVVDGSLYLSNIAIHKKLNVDGYRLTYPNKGHYTIFHPINKKASQAIEFEIFKKLKNVMKKANGNVQEIRL